MSTRNILNNNIPENSIFQNTPYYRIFRFLKYGTRFCDNLYKCFVLLILSYDGSVLGIF